MYKQLSPASGLDDVFFILIQLLQSLFCRNLITNDSTTFSNKLTNTNDNNKTKDDYQYVMHDGNLFKVSKISPETTTDNLVKEPSEKLATLDDQLSKLVKDAVSKISIQKDVST